MRRLIGLAPILLLLVAWQLAVEAKIYAAVLLPAPLSVAQVFGQDEFDVGVRRVG